ncbi:MAG TPA: L-threonine 3-dehydrogenase [Candidatus Polarisedimenticolia bacterium]|nr:L-threonine 3-dehydrogenase [Candidatus Polarisedimenticolia bacterium]
MRALVKDRPGKGLVLKDVPVPRPGPRDVLIRVRRVGLCGTDAHIYAWNAWASGRLKPPVTIGHEFAGVVEEVGSEAAGVRAGDVVTAESHIACGLCVQCRTGNQHICRSVRIIGVDIDGAFADYIVMPAANVWAVDPEIGIDVAAVHDPLGNAFHTVMSADVRGRSVLVTGCGPIGLFCIGIARASGASRIFASEVQPARLELARMMGASHAINPEQTDLERAVRSATEGLGADVVLEMSGHPGAIRDGLRIVRDGGEVCLLGLPGAEVPLDLARDVIFKGITVKGIIGRRMFETWYAMRSFLRAGLLDPAPVITHRFELADFEKAIEAIASGAGKVILSMDGGR